MLLATEFRGTAVDYAPVCDDDGHLLNDPVALRLAEDRLWFSVAESDIVLWAAGIAPGRDSTRPTTRSSSCLTSLRSANPTAHIRRPRPCPASAAGRPNDSRHEDPLRTKPPTVRRR